MLISLGTDGFLVLCRAIRPRRQRGAWHEPHASASVRIPSLRKTLGCRPSGSGSARRSCDSGRTRTGGAESGRGAGEATQLLDRACRAGLPPGRAARPHQRAIGRSAPSLAAHCRMSGSIAACGGGSPPSCGPSPLARATPLGSVGSWSPRSMPRAARPGQGPRHPDGRILSTSWSAQAPACLSGAIRSEGPDSHQLLRAAHQGSPRTRGLSPGTRRNMATSSGDRVWWNRLAHRDLRFLDG